MIFGLGGESRTTRDEEANNAQNSVAKAIVLGVITLTIISTFYLVDSHRRLRMLFFFNLFFMMGPCVIFHYQHH